MFINTGAYGYQTLAGCVYQTVGLVTCFIHDDLAEITFLFGLM